MLFEHVDTERIERLWPTIAQLLGPAVDCDPSGATLDELKAALLTGRFHLVQGSDDEAQGILAFNLFDDEGEVCCFASYLAGIVNGGPKRMIQTMRALMADFEELSRKAGVKRMFIGGRDWGRVFPDYELTGDVPNRRQKRL